MPNQHGAWAMLASPLAVGILAGGPAWVHLPLTAFWFVGYFAFFATSLWLKAGRRARYRPPVRTYGVAALVLGVITVVAQPGLLVWAPLFLLPLGVGLAAAAARRERELLSGLATVVGSGLMTVVAYAAGPGTDLTRAWLLALVQFLYFAGTVYYVKSAIRERGNDRFRRLSGAAHAGATLVVLTFSPWLAVVFVLLTVRAVAVPPLGASPKQLGIGEIVATTVVALVSLLTV
ncbi:YwiC-like family protein [Intrasporangium sp. DVR]